MFYLVLRLGDSLRDEEKMTCKRGRAAGWDARVPCPHCEKERGEQNKTWGRECDRANAAEAEVERLRDAIRGYRFEYGCDECDRIRGCWRRETDALGKLLADRESKLLTAIKALNVIMGDFSPTAGTANQKLARQTLRDIQALT